jgi:predicted RNase H-like HicB family nuclease
MKYLVIFEQTDTGYGAYAPALPGYVATGRTREEVARHLKEAIDLHIDSLRRHGEPVPPPSAVDTDFIEAA